MLLRNAVVALIGCSLSFTTMSTMSTVSAIAEASPSPSVEVSVDSEAESLQNGRPDLAVLFLLTFDNPSDGEGWNQWNHLILSKPQSERIDAERPEKRWPRGLRYRPPDDIASTHYPRRGLYSSANEEVRNAQLHELALAGVKLLVVPFAVTTEQVASFLPHYNMFLEGERKVEERIPQVLDAAAAHGLQVTFSISDFKGRTAESAALLISHLQSRYGMHPAFRPIIFVHGAHRHSSGAWHDALFPFLSGALSTLIFFSNTKNLELDASNTMSYLLCTS